MSLTSATREESPGLDPDSSTGQSSPPEPGRRPRLAPLVLVLSLAALILGCTFFLDFSGAEADNAGRNTIPEAKNIPAEPGILVSQLESGERSLKSLSSLEAKSLLSPASVASFPEASIGELGRALPEIALDEERQPEALAALVFPSTAEVLAMLARDRDVDDYLENAAEPGAAGDYYQAVADLVSRMKPLRSRYETLYEGFYEGLSAMGRVKVPAQTSSQATGYKSGVTLPGLSSKPREREYDLSHTFALDIFLKDVATLPASTLEVGPMIFSLTDGVVVSADSLWRGGEDLSTYRSGGITPKAGNGVIIYSPSKKMYYLYFHLFDVLLETGDAVKKGQPVGRGGNTGTNARKPGHGEHLHLEIYDARSARFLRNREIATLVF